MKPAAWLFAAIIFAAPFGADAAQRQAKISGTQTETHVSGANTPQGSGGGVHASGAVTPAPDKTAPAKKTKRGGPGNPPSATNRTHKEPPAPGEVRQPRQPQQATVESPRSPAPPRPPVAPGGK